MVDMNKKNMRKEAEELNIKYNFFNKGFEGIYSEENLEGTHKILSEYDRFMTLMSNSPNKELSCLEKKYALLSGLKKTSESFFSFINNEMTYLNQKIEKTCKNKIHSALPIPSEASSS